MAFRTEEKLAIEYLVSFLKKSNMHIDYSEGDDPPDAIISFSGNDINVEISQLFQMASLITKEVLKSRKGHDIFGLRFLDELDSEYKQALGGKRLLLILDVPVKDPNKFKAGLKQKIEELIETKEYPVKRTTFVINGENVEIKQISPEPSESKRIIGFVNPTETSSNIHDNACVTLKNAIEKKEARYSKLNLHGNRWLVLINQYFLSDFNSFKRAYDDIEIGHGFQKIFLISEQGEVDILYEI